MAGAGGHVPGSLHCKPGGAHGPFRWPCTCLATWSQGTCRWGPWAPKQWQALTQHACPLGGQAPLGTDASPEVGCGAAPGPSPRLGHSGADPGPCPFSWLPPFPPSTPAGAHLPGVAGAGRWGTNQGPCREGAGAEQAASIHAGVRGGPVVGVGTMRLEEAQPAEGTAEGPKLLGRGGWPRFREGPGQGR